MGLEHNTRKCIYLNTLKLSKTGVLSWTKTKTEVSDISDLMIISKKTKSRFFRYCLETMKRIDEDIEIKRKMYTTLTHHVTPSCVSICFVFVAFWCFLPLTSYHYKG